MEPSPTNYYLSSDIEIKPSTPSFTTLNLTLAKLSRYTQSAHLKHIPKTSTPELQIGHTGAATMEDTESFTLLPLHLDPQSKAISTPSTSKQLQDELAALNALHRTLLTLDSPVPPPPVPVAPKRTAQITKLRESANAAYRSATYPSALQLYSLGLDMALKRPLWEPSGLVRDEVAGLYANRAQTHMAMRSWAEGWKDAEASVEAKKVGNAKAWWRGGRCLSEMGRWEEAREWVGRGLEVEGREGDLVALLKEIEGKIAKGRLA